MNPHIFNTEIQEFIEANVNADVHSILLKKQTFKNVGLAEIAEQLEAKQRCRKKLPSWYSTPNIYYPNKLNIEQSSSEITAAYKSSLVSGDTLVDLTGGFGVDIYYFGKQFKKVLHCEIDEHLSAIVKANFKTLNAQNIEVIHADGLAYLTESKNKFDWIYIDPSRRHDHKGKVFFLKDCLPNVPEHLDMLLEHSDQILIKASPMLDISQGISELRHVKAVHCVAVNNEVKELLFLIEKGYENDIRINAIHLKKQGQDKFSFDQKEENAARIQLGPVQNFIYEPNAALLKAGAFKILSQELKLNKLHQHTHLYTSEELITFPGRCFKVDRVLPYQKKSLKKEVYKMKCNVAVRNFPLSVSDLKRKWKFKDGGDTYLFFTTNAHNDKVVIVASKA
ncbi:MAG: class I SAM-dependent methyltransferase [Flavobacteriaceae bacterium]|nr:class I SAM-dependent methyltransferase [Flavobacteriaceae bacterium]